MFTQNLSFKNFLIKEKKLTVKKNLNLILKEKNQVISSLTKSYKDSFSKKNIKHFSKKFDYRTFRKIWLGFKVYRVTSIRLLSN